MNKIFFLLLITSTLFASDPIEKDLEEKLKASKFINLNESTITYDIDIYSNLLFLDIKIEANEIVNKNLNYDDLSLKFIKVIKEQAPSIENVDILIEEFAINETKKTILYQQNFSMYYY